MSHQQDSTLADLASAQADVAALFSREEKCPKRHQGWMEEIKNGLVHPLSCVCEGTGTQTKWPMRVIEGHEYCGRDEPDWCTKMSSEEQCHGLGWVPETDMAVLMESLQHDPTIVTITFEHGTCLIHTMRIGKGHEFYQGSSVWQVTVQMLEAQHTAASRAP